MAGAIKAWKSDRCSSMGGDTAGAEMGRQKSLGQCPAGLERGAVVCSVPRRGRAAWKGLGWLPTAMARNG